MSKKEKSKKATTSLPDNYEGAVEALEAKVAERRAARKTLEKFATDNGLNAKKDHSDHKKLGKQYAELRAPWATAKEEEAALEAHVKSLKPASNGNAKYEYPSDITTAEDKKKHRAKMRAAAKKAEKGDAAEKPAKKSKAKEEAPAEKTKKSKKEEAPAVEEKTAKKKKKKVVAEDED